MHEEADVPPHRSAVVGPARVAPGPDAPQVVLVRGRLAALGGGGQHLGYEARPVLLVVVADEDPGVRGDGGKGTEVLGGCAVVGADGDDDAGGVGLGPQVGGEGERTEALVVAGDA